MCFSFGVAEGEGRRAIRSRASRRGTGSFHKAPEKAESPGKCWRDVTEATAGRPHCEIAEYVL